MNEVMNDAIVALIDQNISRATGSKANIKASSLAGEKTLRKLRIEKLFEVVALSELLPRLKDLDPKMSFALRHGGAPGKKLVLQSAPGLADLSKSYIVASLPDQPGFATIWTNVEILAQSAKFSGGGGLSGTYHEADVVMLDHTSHLGATGPVRPAAASVMVMMECKFLNVLPKAVLRTMLGLRRELAMWTQAQPTRLSAYRRQGYGSPWFAPQLPAKPASHLIFCYPNQYGFYPVLEWQLPGQAYGIEYWPL